MLTVTTGGPLLAIFGLGFGEIGVLVLIGVLLFGRKLPEVGRSLGKTFVEFKKGVKGLEEEIEATSADRSPSSVPAVEAPKPPQRVTAPTTPRFDDDAPQQDAGGPTNRW